MRNTIILSGIAIMAIIGGVVFYMGKTGSISADVENKDCKFYTFTDRKTYAPNQTMNLGIKNDKYSKCVLKIRDDIGPWTVIDANNKTVYKADSTGSSTTNLKPGQRQDWQWNGRGSNGMPVPTGVYKVKFTSLNKDAQFTISSY